MLVCDAVESGLDESVVRGRLRTLRAEPGDIEGLGWPEDRAQPRTLEDLVEPTLTELTRRTEQQAASILDRIDIERVPADKRTLVASDYIARAAYADNEPRKSGREYYTHAQEAAAMALFALEQIEAEARAVNPDFVINPQFKAAVISLALLHDGVEDTMRSCKYYEPDRPEGFSALLVRNVFDLTENENGVAIANSLRLMTHYANQPWAPDYSNYVTLGSADFMFCVAKAADIWHNLHIEPKPITRELSADAVLKILGKQALYAAGFRQISIKAPTQAQDQVQAIWARRYFDIMQSIDGEDMPQLVDNLTGYIYGDTPVPQHAEEVVAFEQNAA